jgi:hypothetical protein
MAVKIHMGNLEARVEGLAKDARGYLLKAKGESKDGNGIQEMELAVRTIEEMSKKALKQLETGIKKISRY